MIPLQPQQAPVRPRVICPESGEALPLEEVVQPLIERGDFGLICLNGPPGSGKTTALRHLAAVLPPDKVVLCKSPNFQDFCSAMEAKCLLVFANQQQQLIKSRNNFALAPWSQDECIEYLLAVHKDRCASVMSRLQSAKAKLNTGLPAIWRVVLDQMAEETWIPDPRLALFRHIARQLDNPKYLDQLERACLECYNANRPSNDGLVWMEKTLKKAGLERLLDYSAVQLLLAVQHVMTELRQGGKCRFLRDRLSRELVQEAAAQIRGDERTQEHLLRLLVGKPWAHAMAASLLHQAGTGWVPDGAKPLNLSEAYLDGAAWPDAQLCRAELKHAQLPQAYLSRANLENCNLIQANLTHGNLSRTSLKKACARQANLSHADLSFAQAERADFTAANLTNAVLDDGNFSGCSLKQANLKKASLRETDLTRANLTAAKIEGADFTAANLRAARLSKLRLREATFTGVCFICADLRKCDMEYMDLAGLDFQQAHLDSALLTGCILTEADFTKANLRWAKMADVNLEGACLRGADLTGVSFHMGSSRSGMVFSPYPCEGSKTGFYTDDYDEQHFKAPEEIRKANLCRADLRGACLDDVDFYLVDLRGALYDPEQEPLLRRSGAILVG